MKKKQASTTIYMVFFFIMFLAFFAFAVDGTIVFTNRVKLQNATEATALAAAAEFNYSTTDVETNVSTVATDTFNLLKKDSLENAELNVKVNVADKKVLITTNMTSQPFFLAFLGVSGINLEAKSCAVCEGLFVKSGYPKISWLNPKAAYLSNILSLNSNFNDTAILYPLGGGVNSSASYDSATGKVKFNLIDADDNNPLSLGPGGFITIKLPAPIVDKPGNDLFIKELGSLEGYFVFAGLDNNADNPYVQKGNEGDGISWVNISCSATPEDESSGLSNSDAQTTNMGSQSKFYGSAYFDIGASCTGGISMVKYIRIIDDNQESAFVKNGGNYYKTMMYGEASSATAGADIDYVKVLSHVKLISPSDF